MTRRLTVVLVLLLVVAGAAGAAPAFRDVRATLKGEVLADGLARPGDVVRDGDPLVWVRTVAGRGVAARAPQNGVIIEVLVRPGQLITEKGTVVARLDPK